MKRHLKLLRKRSPSQRHGQTETERHPGLFLLDLQMASNSKRSLVRGYEQIDNIEPFLRCGAVLTFDVVETYSSPSISVKILRGENQWFVAWVNLEDSERSKVLACISFEHASKVFDECLSKLKECRQ